MLYIILFSVVTSCNNASHITTIQSSNVNLVLVNGALELNNIPFSGRLISNHFNNQLKSELFYVDGKKHGTEKYWNEKGVLSQERYYTKGLKTGIHRAWWDSGTPKFIYHFNT